MMGHVSLRTLGAALAVPLLWYGAEPVLGQTAALLEDERNTIEVFERASPSIVHIDARNTTELRFSMHERMGSSGTGFAFDGQGHILTAFHVIQDMNQIDVILHSGQRLSARLVGTAPQLDIAVLKVEAFTGELRPLPTGDSMALRPGQKMIAIGNPFGLHNTVSVGVVSAVERSLDELPIELGDALIQTDAAINPGSSGGPLLNSAGEVVGISVAIVETADNLGFAVPIHLVNHVTPDLIEMGHPYQPVIGFSGSAVTANTARLFGLPLEQGFLVEEVLPGSLAAAAGLRAGRRVVVLGEKTFVLGGDIITQVNGRKVSSGVEISRAILEARPGQELRLRIHRDGQIVSLSLRLEKMKM
jgi:S1-C subfamily serine protease